MSPLRAFLHRFVLALALAFALSAGGIGFGLWLWNDTVDSAERADVELAEPEQGEPANFLIIGSDTRSFVDDPLDAEHFGEEGDAGGQRSDTIMIAHVDPDAKTGFLVSFPRDLWVEIPGLGEAKINAAFNAGPQRVVDTIKLNFDVDVHHYLEVNFDGFRGLVDAIGDVPIYFPTPARDLITGLLISEAGCHELDGEQALAYVRSREYQYQVGGGWETDGTGDLGRIRRQQYFIRSLADEAVRAGFRNPLKIDDILDEAFGSLRVDPGLTGNDLKALIRAFRDVDPAELDMVTVPNTPETIDGQAALRVIPEQAAAVFARLRFGDDSGGEEAPPDIDPGDIRVAVRNGSGVQGQARAAFDALADLGFSTVDPPGNADRDDYDRTEVRYAPGAEDEARVVAAHLGGIGELVPLREAPADAEVLVVLGRDFEAVAAPQAPAPQAPAPGDTAATVPESTTTTAPANPGSEAPLPAAGC